MGSNPISLSDNGRYSAFVSSATNLVDDDTNELNDIFLHDADLGITRRINVHPDGGESTAEASHPVISGNGNNIVFVSTDLALTSSSGEVNVAHIYRWHRTRPRTSSRARTPTARPTTSTSRTSTPEP